MASLRGNHFFPIAFVWKGSKSSWDSLAQQLDPELRGPMAYCFGHRYVQLKTPDVKSRREEALMFIRTAQKDAPAGSELRQLAQQEIQRLDAK